MEPSGERLKPLFTYSREGIQQPEFANLDKAGNKSRVLVKGGKTFGEHFMAMKRFLDNTCTEADLDVEMIIGGKLLTLDALADAPKERRREVFIEQLSTAARTLNSAWQSMSAEEKHALFPDHIQAIAAAQTTGKWSAPLMEELIAINQRNNLRLREKFSDKIEAARESAKQSVAALKDIGLDQSVIREVQKRMASVEIRIGDPVVDMYSEGLSDLEREAGGFYNPSSNVVFVNPLFLENASVPLTEDQKVQWVVGHELQHAASSQLHLLEEVKGYAVESPSSDIQGLNLSGVHRKKEKRRLFNFKSMRTGFAFWANPRDEQLREGMRRLNEAVTEFLGMLHVKDVWDVPQSQHWFEGEDEFGKYSALLGAFGITYLDERRGLQALLQTGIHHDPDKVRKFNQRLLLCIEAYYEDKIAERVSDKVPKTKAFFKLMKELTGESVPDSLKSL